MIAVLWKVIGALTLMLLGAAGTYQFNGWLYTTQLAEQARLYTNTLSQITRAGAGAQKAEQDRRLALEQTLLAGEQAHFEKLTNDQKDKARLRDCLASADIRLSVLVREDSIGTCSVPVTPITDGVVHGIVRAERALANAQRIVTITDYGDRGLITLQVCQAYIRETLKN